MNDIEAVPYETLYARALNANAPRSLIWGPTRGFRSMDWTESWAYGSWIARNPNPINPATEGMGS